MTVRIWRAAVAMEVRSKHRTFRHCTKGTPGRSVLLGAVCAALAAVACRPASQGGGDPSSAETLPRVADAGESSTRAEAALMQKDGGSGAADGGTAGIVCPEGASLREEVMTDPLRMRTVWCETEDGLRHGPYKEWRENGQLATDFTYRLGVKDGLQRTWFKNGTLRSEETWRDGQPAGAFRHWHGNGQLASKARYIDGKCVGVQRFWDMWGRLIDERKNCVVPETYPGSTPQDLRYPRSDPR